MENEEVAKKVAAALHPPRCPQCGEEIDYLRYLSFEGLDYPTGSSPAIYYGKLWNSGPPNVTRPEGSTNFHCPFCKAVLFTDDESAIKFVKGEE